MDSYNAFTAEYPIARGRIPFEMKITKGKPLSINKLTKEQFDAEIQAGMDDIHAGRVIPAEEIEAEMNRMFDQLNKSTEWS